MQVCRDSSSFVLELVGVWRTSENGDQSGIKLELCSWREFYLQVCAACLTPRLIPKGSNPVHSLGTKSMTLSLPGLGWIQQSDFHTAITSYPLCSKSHDAVFLPTNKQTKLNKRTCLHVHDKLNIRLKQWKISKFSIISCTWFFISQRTSNTE
jgi:hypothetical protein